MATVFHSQRRYRVVVYSNDHPPSHVHVLGKGCEARYRLNCPDGPVTLWDYEGDWTFRHIVELGEEIAAHLDDCCVAWSRIHG